MMGTKVTIDRLYAIGAATERRAAPPGTVIDYVPYIQGSRALRAAALDALLARGVARLVAHMKRCAGARDEHGA